MKMSNTIDDFGNVLRKLCSTPQPSVLLV